MSGDKTFGGRVRQWFNGGDPQGREKIRSWATGDDGRWHGYTHSMGKYVTWLMVIACVLYPFTKGIGSILALLVAIFLMGGRAMIERQVRRDVSDLEEAKHQYKRTSNPEYLEFMVLRSEGLLEDNKILTPASRKLLEDYLAWARARRKNANGSQEPQGDAPDGAPETGRTGDTEPGARSADSSDSAGSPDTHGSSGPQDPERS